MIESSKQSQLSLYTTAEWDRVSMVMLNIKFRVERCLYLVRVFDGGFR